MSEESPSIDIGRRSLLKGFGVAAGVTVLGASGIAVGQDSPEGPPIEWQQDYSGGEREYDLDLQFVTQADDGEYALAGYGSEISETGAGPEQFAVVGADEDGDQQWITFASDDSEETERPRPEAIARTGDGGYAVVGHLMNPSERAADQRSGYHAAAVKLTAEGDVEWVETINTFDGEEEGRTDETSAQLRDCTPAGEDGSFVACGNKEGDGWVVEFTADGDLAWENTWTDQGDDEYDSVIVDDVRARENGGYLLFSSQGGEQQNLHHAVYTDSSGNVEDRVELMVDYSETPYNHDFIPTSDGGYAYTGRDAGMENFVLAKLDADGEQEWREEYEGPGEAGDWANTVVQTTDGGFALGGYMSEAYSLQSQPAILKTAADGTEQWERLYPETDDNDMSDFVETADSGYAFVTHPNSLNKVAPDDVADDDGDGGTETPDDGTDTPDDGTDTPDDGDDSETDTPDDGDDGETDTETPENC